MGQAGVKTPLVQEHGACFNQLCTDPGTHSVPSRALVLHLCSAPPVLLEPSRESADSSSQQTTQWVSLLVFALWPGESADMALFLCVFELQGVCSIL